MMTLIRPFGPTPGSSTANIAVTASNQTISVPISGIGFQSIRAVNLGTRTIFIEFGKDNSTTPTAATSTSIPMLPNSAEVFILPPDCSTLAVISDGTGNTLYLTVGQGV